MKKILAVIAIAGFMVACNNKADTKEENKDSLNNMVDSAKNAMDAMVDSTKDAINTMADSTKAAMDKMAADSVKK
jgi:PBP1b-binding outer membrane lipoprotein LpoB